MVHLASEVNGYVQRLKRCTRLKTLADAKIVHAHMLMCKDAPTIILENTLVDAYAKCGSIADAKRVFDSIKQPNLFSWTVIITAYAQHSQFEEVVGLFQGMQSASVQPDRVVFMFIINACTNLASSQVGELVHTLVVEHGQESDGSIGKNLVEMYKRCGMIHDASKVFEVIRNRDVVLWTALVAGYVQYGLWGNALFLFRQMKSNGIEPNEYTLVSVIKACAGLEESVYGMYVHSWIFEGSLESNMHAANALMDMYTKCGCLNDACNVFNKMHNPDVISWTTIIAGHTKSGLGRDALMLFDRMNLSGVCPNCITYNSALQACAGMECSKSGMHVHAHIIRSGVHMDVCVHNSLIDMYTQCGYVQDARHTFDGMPEHDISTWTAIISCYVELGAGEEALHLFRCMQMEGIKADAIVFVSALRTCAALGILLAGKQFHAQIVVLELLTEAILGSALVDMYAKCGNLDNAMKAFRKLHEPDVVSWTAVIACYGEHELSKEALLLFEEMVGMCVQPNVVTYVAVLKVLGNLMEVERGRQMHTQIVCCGYDDDVFIGSGLLDLYAKCRRIDDGQSVFDRLQKPDNVSWNALITGYVQAQLFDTAFVLFEKMHRMGLQPDAVTSVAILKACVEREDLKLGKQVHGGIVERGFEYDAFVSSTLIDLYAKCGCLNDSIVLFRKIKSPDLVPWNAILGGCAQQGHSKYTIELFEQMRHSLVKPDIITFGCVLAACSHGGLLEKGKHYFDVMTQVYGLKPLPWHCACIVDLYGRAGHLSDAKEFISKLPIQPDAIVWMTMLAACKNHSNFTLGCYAFNNVIKLDRRNASAYVLMSNIYAAVGRWSDAANVRKQMETAGLKNQERIELNSSDVDDICRTITDSFFVNTSEGAREDAT